MGDLLQDLLNPPKKDSSLDSIILGFVAGLLLAFGLYFFFTKTGPFKVADPVKQKNKVETTDIDYSKSNSNIETTGIDDSLVLAVPAGSKFTSESSISTGQYFVLGKYYLVLPPNGKLAIYSNVSNVEKNIIYKFNATGSKLVLQGDNNLVLYDLNGNASWSTGTAGNGVLPTVTAPSVLTISDNGVLSLVDSKSNVLWDNNVDALLKISLNQIYDLNDGASLVLQNDGNFLLKKNGNALWGAMTDGKGGIRVVLLSDGNLVMYNAAGNQVWSTGKSGEKDYKTTLTFDSNFRVAQIKKSNGSVVWQTPIPPSYQFPTGSVLKIGETLDFGGGVGLTIQGSDGNLVLNRDGKPIWAAGISNRGTEKLSMLWDNNLVLSGRNASTLWESKTDNKGTKDNNASLRFNYVDNKMELISNGQIIWST